MNLTKKFKYIKIVILLTFLFVGTSLAQTFKGKVVGVVDGDTVTVLDSQYRQITVRLAGIDAPEKKQDFGEAAKEYLAGLIFQKKITVVGSKKDRYGRTIAKILLDGKDINLAMIEAGFAWHYKEYEDEQAEEDRDLYSASEIRARQKLFGLWLQPNAVKPSEWRKQEKERAEQNRQIEQPKSERIILPPVPVNSNSNNTNGGADSNSDSTNKTVEVRGYTRKDGTYVAPHRRSLPRKNN